VAAPNGVTYVAIDFATDALGPTLRTAGLDAPAFFAWLGVTPYLEEAAIWQTLNDIGSFSVAGGGVVFDYSIPPSSIGFVQRFFFRRLERRVAKAGEPFKSYFAPDALARGLRDIGFTRITDLGEAEINSQFFANRKDGLRVGAVGRIMVALR
jgi:O-methyltransferase involved in polyketide biosynthesis